MRIDIEDISSCRAAVTVKLVSAAIACNSFRAFQFFTRFLPPLYIPVLISIPVRASEHRRTNAILLLADAFSNASVRINW